jgi:hypothetical protein
MHRAKAMSGAQGCAVAGDTSRFITAPDEQQRCCVLDRTADGQQVRCPNPTRYWVGKNGVDDYTYCCKKHLAQVRGEDDAVRCVGEPYDGFDVASEKQVKELEGRFVSGVLVVWQAEVASTEKGFSVGDRDGDILLNPQTMPADAHSARTIRSLPCPPDPSRPRLSPVGVRTRQRRA